MKVVVIGGVAAGPKTASRIIRLCPDASIVMIDKGEFLSYAGCGLPYYISGVVKHRSELMSTPVGVVRDSVFFSKVKHIEVRNRTEALSIDRTARSVRVRSSDGSESDIPYDKLVIATGAAPAVPPFPGVGLRNIFTLQKIEDADSIRDILAQRKARDVVIVGGGLIGVEMAEAFVQCGCRVTIVERLPHILPMLDDEVAADVEHYLESEGIKVRTGVSVRSFDGDDVVRAVMTDAGELQADIVLVAVGVKPNVNLAVSAGLELGPTGAIKVDEHMRTSDPDIYAAGDCAEQTDLVTGKPCFVPLGSTANKQGRVAANNICGHADVFAGVMGSAVCKVFDYTVARTGLNEKQARAAGIDVVSTVSVAPDKAHFYPDARNILLKLVVDNATRRLLGVQAVGKGDAAMRVNAAVAAIGSGMTIDDVAELDLCYAPPYTPAMDNLLTAANIVRNKLDGLYEAYTVAEVKAKLARGDDMVLLDVRMPSELAARSIPGALNIPLGKLRENCAASLPRDKEIVTFCKISLRGYEAALILKSCGFRDVKVMEGGIVLW